MVVKSWIRWWHDDDDMYRSQSINVKNIFIPTCWQWYLTIIIENHHHSSIDICCIVHGFVCHATYNSLYDDDDDVGADECRWVILTQTYADDDGNDDEVDDEVDDDDDNERS